jgi:hypothetical protein
MRYWREHLFDDVQDPDERDRRVVRYNASPVGRVYPIRPTRWGYGLFSAEGVEDGSVIGEYVGFEVREIVADHLPDEYDKVIPSARPGFSRVGNVQPRDQPLNFPSYANDPGFMGTRQTGFFKVQPNVKLISVGDRVLMVATTRIPPGGEVLLHYGYDYWKDRGYYPTAQLERDARQANQRRVGGRVERDHGLDICAGCAKMPAKGACPCAQVRVCGQDCLATVWKAGHGLVCPLAERTEN